MNYSFVLCLCRQKCPFEGDMKCLDLMHSVFFPDSWKKKLVSCCLKDYKLISRAAYKRLFSRSVMGGENYLMLSTRASGAAEPSLQLPYHTVQWERAHTRIMYSISIFMWKKKLLYVQCIFCICSVYTCMLYQILLAISQLGEAKDFLLRWFWSTCKKVLSCWLFSFLFVKKKGNLPA